MAALFINENCLQTANSSVERNHQRSASWSHASWIGHTIATTSSMASLFSPMRVIQGIVPTFTNTVQSVAAPSSSTAMMNNSAQNSRAPVALSNNRMLSQITAGHVRTRSEASRHSRQSSSVEIDLGDELISVPTTTNESMTGSRATQEHMEFLGTISWVEKALPFILLLLSRIMWDHRLGILVFIGMFGTYFHVNNTIKKQVGLKEKRLNQISIGIFIFLFANIFFIYYVFKMQRLDYCLVFQRPYFKQMDLWTVFWAVGITDFVVRYATMATKCIVVIMPRRLVHFRKRGKFFLLIENVSQLYRNLLPTPQWYIYFTNYPLGGEYFAVVSTAAYLLIKIRTLFLKMREVISAVRCFWEDTRYGKSPSKEVLLELADACPICQEEMDEPIELNACKHIFCEDCIVMWFDRERTCPMCRAVVAEDPLWRDGNTQAFMQVF